MTTNPYAIGDRVTAGRGTNTYEVVEVSGGNVVVENVNDRGVRYTLGARDVRPTNTRHGDPLALFPIIDAQVPGKAIVVELATDTPEGAAPCYLVIERADGAYDTIVERSYIAGAAIAKAIALAGWAKAVVPEVVGDEELGRELADLIVTTTGRAAAQPQRRAIIERHVTRWDAEAIDLADAEEAGA
jgi:hypothetical protein